VTSRLSYSDKGHRYTLDGARVPSVTGITGVLDKPGLPWAAARETALWALHNRELVDQLGDAAWLRTATGHHRDVWDSKRDRGSNLHASADALVTTGYVDVPPEQFPLVEVAADFLDRWDVRPVFNEAAVFSLEHRYAGRLDLIGELSDGNVWLLDFKTGSGVYPEMALQMAGYRYSEYISADDQDVPTPNIDRCAIVHVQESGWDLVPLEVDRETFGTFLACQAIHAWKQRPAQAVVLAPVPVPEVD
jgi:hypothetical protein